MSNLTTLALSIGLGVASALPLAAQVDSTWTQPFPPFHIAGNLYYVGTKALASYLVTTPNGLILINSDLEQNVPQQARRQRAVPGDRAGFREDISCVEGAAVRHLPRRTWSVLRHGEEIREVQGRRRDGIRGPRGLQGLRRRTRAGVSRGAGEANGN